jgi:biopolymer transport protein ExbB/TolQ
MSKAVQEGSERLQIGLSLASREVLEALTQKERRGASFLVGTGLASLAYVAIWRFFPGGALYDFFYARGPAQFASTILFFWGVVLALCRGLKLKQELRALGFSLPQQNLDAEGDLALAEQIPPPYRESLLGQRLMQLLKGYGRGEEVAPLLDRLAQQDRVALQQRYALLSFIRTVLPLLGLIGTVLGFNQQMPNFVEFSQAAQDLEALRHQLQQFAGGLSTAFDTTLLALAYMLILWPWIFFLVRREEELLGTIDGIVQETAGRLQKVSPLSQELHQVLQGANDQFFKHLERTLEAATAHSLEAFRRGIQQGIDGRSPRMDRALAGRALPDLA